jgi:hypothetical protein
MEIWKDIIGYEGYYQVSNYGRVKSVTTKLKRERILKANYCGPKRNYIQLDLCKNSIRKKHKLHRLVAEHFLSNPNNYPLVMHLDNNPSNNSVSNLQWGTHKENLHQMTSEGRRRNQYS